VPKIQSKEPTSLLITIPEAAHRLSLCRGTVYNLIRDGVIPTVRIRRAVRVPLASIARLAEPSEARRDVVDGRAQL